jgi:hypothetical protein
VASGDGTFRLTIGLEQVQPGEPYRLIIPLVITLEGERWAQPVNVEMTKRGQVLELKLPRKPVRIDVDPGFDLFRRLDRREIPPALTQAFGAEKAVIVTPSSGNQDLLESYRGMARFLIRTGPGGVEVKDDREMEGLPSDTSVWILGWRNRLLEKVLPSFEEYGVKVAPREGMVDLPGMSEIQFNRDSHAIVLTGRHPKNSDLAVLWIAADNRAAHLGLARKLPHYHKYSYLGFAGDEPENVAKGQWPVVGSPLTKILDAGSEAAETVPMGNLPETQALIERPVPFFAGRMMEDILILADRKMKGRALGTKELNRAAEHIANRFQEAGLEPGGTMVPGSRPGLRERGSKQYP